MKYIGYGELCLASIAFLIAVTQDAAVGYILGTLFAIKGIAFIWPDKRP